MHPFTRLMVPNEAVGIHWFGQSSFALKHPDGTIVQIDPYYPRERPADRFIHSQPPLEETTLPTDYVLLTHNHADHTCVESIQRIQAAYPEVRFIGPIESIQHITANGIARDHCITVTAGDTTALGAMTVHAVRAKPPEGLADDNIPAPDVEHLGFVVDTGRVRVYISGDLAHTFARHESLLAPVRALKPDIGLLTTHPTEGEFPFFEGSVKIATALGLKTVTPAHYQCFVTRNYDPRLWASLFPEGGPKPLVIPYNQSIVYTPAED